MSMYHISVPSWPTFMQVRLAVRDLKVLGMAVHDKQNYCGLLCEYLDMSTHTTENMTYLKYLVT